jgi:hypothetical protein
MQDNKFFDEEVEISIEKIEGHDGNVTNNIEIYYVSIVVTYIKRQIDLIATVSINTDTNTIKRGVCVSKSRVGNSIVSANQFEHLMSDLILMKNNMRIMYLLQLIYFSDKEVKVTDTELILLSKEEIITDAIKRKGLLDEVIGNSLLKLRNKYITTAVEYINIENVQSDIEDYDLRPNIDRNSMKRVPSETIVQAEAYYLNNVIDITAEFNYSFKNVINYPVVLRDKQLYKGYISIECKCKCVAIRDMDSKRIALKDRRVELTDKMEIIAREYDVDSIKSRNRLAVSLLNETRIFDDLLTRMRTKLKED